MNTKRNRRNNIDAPATNNFKKSKNLISIESNEDVYSNGKNKKKENAIIPINMKTGIVDKKRKLSDTDILTLTSKKAKKRGKLYGNLEDVEEVSYLPEFPSNDLDKKEAKKGKKKNKTPLTNDECCINNGTNDMNETINLIEPLMQKVGKKKNKIKKEITYNDEINNQLNYYSPIKEVGTSYDTIDIPEDFNNMKTEVIKTEQCLENGVVHITIQDVDDNNSDIHKIDISKHELFPDVLQQKENSEVIKIKPVISWPQEDLRELVDRMEARVPEIDTLAFGTRAEKLEWDAIAFKEYSGEECKKTWFLLQKQIRRFRLLKEVLADAKEWINAPKSKKGKKNRHPDMPRKPLTAFFIYYLQKKDEFNKIHPGLDATELSKLLGQEYKSLTPENRAKYELLALKKKKEYEKNLEEFYQTHPDVPRVVKAPKIKPEKKIKPPKPPKPIKEKPPKPIKERVPKRPPIPFHYYYLTELENQKEIDDRLVFKELCKDRWKQLPDEQKVVWINKAETEYAKYEEALTKYLETHPEYVQNPHKPLLTKEEVQIKDRVAGKPSKPPCSAYNLFARVMLQSEEIKSVNVKDRLNFVSSQWKLCPEDEKKQYRDRSLKLNEKYKLEYASYLETLPEDEKKLELERNMPKRRKSESIETEKKEKPVKKKSEKKAATKKIVEPEQPPISAFKYFATLYEGKESASQAWKNLSPEQKKVYENELVKKKQAYIVNFEKFLKSLTKEELEAFSNSRRRVKKNEEEEEEEEEEEDEEETETSDESGTEDSGAGSNAEEEGEDEVD